MGSRKKRRIRMLHVVAGWWRWRRWRGRPGHLNCGGSPAVRCVLSVVGISAGGGLFETMAAHRVGEKLNERGECVLPMCCCFAGGEKGEEEATGRLAGRVKGGYGGLSERRRMKRELGFFRRQK
ncbi:hypothetical protein HAX54_008367, partial [Datura stramonium]|nr:hypothetical protein [Datura stramonium]